MYLKRFKAIWKKYEWWQWVLFLIAGLTILSILGALFLAAGSEPSGHYTNTDIAEISDPSFITDLSVGLHARAGQGGTATPLTNGDQFRDQLFASIDHAESSINFSVYIWENGKFTYELLAKLTEKQKQGVEVRIIFDSLGTKIDTDLLKPLVDAGGKVETFRGIKFGQLTRYGHRNHRRSIVIDGKEGFTGGMAVADKWLGNAEDPEHWRDEMYKVTGPLAMDLQGDFTDIWSGITGEFLVGPKFYPTDIALSQDESALKFIHISHTPSPDVQILPDFIVNSISAAHKTLYIETPYFVPNNQLIDAIIARAKAGVDVRMVLPNHLNDSKIDRYASQNYYAKLIENGVKIYEYEPTFNHTKFFVVDGQWSVIGSANLNTRSRRLDEENLFGILDKEFANKNTQIFMEDISKSKEINLSEWKRRSLLKRPIEWLAKILDEQI